MELILFYFFSWDKTFLLNILTKPVIVVMFIWPVLKLKETRCAWLITGSWFSTGLLVCDMMLISDANGWLLCSLLKWAGCICVCKAEKFLDLIHITLHLHRCYSQFMMLCGLQKTVHVFQHHNTLNTRMNDIFRSICILHLTLYQFSN